ncbi:MAG: hypothetical protein OSJ43_11590 [Oscillospiraceae bacterium]|nr:hypothetical protein [Oscillospiraceae bacterium]
MNKQIFILNGTAGAGKDTFANLLNEHYPTKHISSITPIKNAAEALGWSGEKTPEYREFLCEMKKFVNSKGEFIWNYLDKEVEAFREDNKTQILLIDIREPDEIKKAVYKYDAKTILIERRSMYKTETVSSIGGVPLHTHTIPVISSNTADSGVYNYAYDYRISNNGSIEEFKKNVNGFAKKIAPPEWDGIVIAVDFDNTLAKTEYPKIIEPIPETINFIRNAKAKGAEIILYTCREGKELNEALEWCKQNNVPIDRANENSPTRVKHWGNDCRKIDADLYLDDKACSLWHDRRDCNDLMSSLFDVIYF